MSGFVIEDLDLIADTRVYDIAKFFGLEYKQDRLAHKEALHEILTWGEKKAKTNDINKILVALNHKERGLVRDGMEPRINHFRRSIFIEELTPETRSKPRNTKPKVEEKVEEKPVEVKQEEVEIAETPVPQPSWAEQFKQGFNGA